MKGFDKHKEEATKIFIRVVKDSYFARGLVSDAPSEAEIREACERGYKTLDEYCADYNIRAFGIDLVKLFCFSTVALRQQRGADERLIIDPIWNGILLAVAIMHRNGISLARMPDLKGTCKILEQLSRENNSKACYCYVKGVEEAAMAVIPL